LTVRPDGLPASGRGRALDGPDEHHQPLTEAGHEQAVALAAALVGFGVSQVVSSPFLRAVQTIEPTARALGLPICQRDDLREWRSGLAPIPDWQAHYEQSWAQPDLATATHGTWISRALLALGLSIDCAFWLSIPMPAICQLSFGGPHLHSALGPGLNQVPPNSQAR